MGSKVSFNKKSEGAAKKKTVSKKKSAPKKGKAEVAKRESSPPATVSGSSGIEGEITEDDIIIPRLNIINAMSDLHTEEGYDVGSLVMAKEVELMDKEGEISFVALKVRKRYQQKIPFGADEDPIICDTRQEVKDNEGTTNWSKEAVENLEYFEQRADMVLAILMPEDVAEEHHHHFPFEIDGDRWARVAYTVKGSGFKACAKSIISQGMGKLRNIGLELGRFTMTSDKRNHAGNTWYVTPTRFRGVETDKAYVGFLQDLAARDVRVEEEGEE